MNTLNDKYSAPSLGRILMATVLALIGAAIVLAVAVLPAEYGIDPLGTGQRLGLMSLNKAAGAGPAAATPAATDGASIIPVLEPVERGAPRLHGAFLPQRERFKVDSREIQMQVGEGLEIKYNMKKGAGLLYSWTSTEPLYFEFHGDPNKKPEGREGTDYYETYELDEKGKAEFHGTFVAPSTGIHGWFWQNKSGHMVTLNLVTSGYYEWVFQNREEKQSALKPTDTDVIPRHPKVPDVVMK